MKKFPFVILIISVVFSISCSRKTSEIINSIPDHAFAVASVHPKQIYDKGKIGSMESITSKVRNEMILSIVDNPLASGINMSEYIYFFTYFIDDEPIIAVTADLKDQEKFTGMLEELLKEQKQEIILHRGFNMITPEFDGAAMAWNEKQMIFLASPQKPMSSENWQTELIRLFELKKDQSINTIVNFKDFTGKMEDLNVWFTGDELKKILEKTDVLDNMEFDLPMDLDNNYGQMYVKFEDEAIYIHSETHFSDDVKKATETFMVAKDRLNKDLLKLAPGNDLLMGMAFSLEIDKIVKLMKNINPPQMEGAADQIEAATGIAGEEMLEALNGDFVIAVNGASAEAAIPVEIMIGIGVDDETLQEKLMGTVGNMAPVEKEGDFFMINVGGIELYSGIVKGIWVITNKTGYKNDVTGKGLEKTLSDSEFSNYANGSMGMYLNLDLTTYPAALQSMMAQGNAPKILEQITESFTCLGIEASNQKNDLILKSAKENENSLYTLLQLIEKAQKSN